MNHTATTSLKLRDVYRVLRDHFGYTHPWWPGTPLQITLTALLVQQCDWSAARDAVVRLQEAGLLSIAALAVTTNEDIARCIRGVTFAPTKAQRMIQMAIGLRQGGYETIEDYLSPARDKAELRTSLLSFRGIGQETADCILCFAGETASFVVDNSLRRVFRRLDLFPEQGAAFWSRSYSHLKAFFEHHLLADLSLYDEFAFEPSISRELALLRDYHALIVELARHHCLRTRPLCNRPGRPGWNDFAFCQSHCAAHGCCACPLADRCRSNDAQIEAIR